MRFTGLNMVEVWAKVADDLTLVVEKSYLPKMKDFIPGAVVKIDIKQGRKLRPHNFMMAIIDRAFEHWPSGHRFPAQNPDHLRAWLLVHARHFTIFGETVRKLTNPLIMVGFMQEAMSRTMAAGGYSFTVERHGSIAVYIPKSIAFAKIDECEIRPIREAVFEIIEIETGLKIDDLRREARGELAA
jgi:hypothetical protein